MTDYDEIDEKALIMQQNALLTAILDELRDETQEPDTKQVECLVCMQTLPETEKAEHAKSCFGWHESMGQDALDSKYDTANDK